jgi:anthranilate phosphoribosyltransferase
MREVLDGKKGAYRDAVVANSGLCLYIAGKAVNPADGARKAEEIIDSGKAEAKLEKYINLTRKYINK